MSDIYVLIEHLNGNVEDISYEMLGMAKAITAETGGSTVALLLGQGNEGLANDLGADSVIYVDDAALANFNPEAYTKTVSAILSDKQPKGILIGNTSMGMDVSAGLSVGLDWPFVAFASKVSSTNAVSQLYGGKMNVESQFEGSHFIVSVLAGASSVADGKGSGASVEPYAAPDLSGLSVQFKQLIQPVGGDVDITSQEILVSVGRGIQGEDNLEMMEELASKLGGAVSCSRPIVDNKWLEKTRQVGKSGLKVKPKVYLSCGISGAPEHIEGMKDAELIIAINTDSNAPIFDYAHYGVTEDLFDVVPALIDIL